jgi:uncharacterized protein YdeI (YjbR/CyaY-like superfamily)
MNPKVSEFLTNAKKWQEEMSKLRTIVLNCGLTEELKWGKPCYTCDGNNIVLIHGFKEYCALLLFKGVLLKDQHGILVQQTPNVQAARQIRFANLQEITELAQVITAYIHEAIAVENSKLTVNYKQTAEFAIPEELQAKFDEMPALKSAFTALTPGRQKAYLLYFAAPKQLKTQAARVAKCLQQILNGKGLND